MSANSPAPIVTVTGRTLAGEAVRLELAECRVEVGRAAYRERVHAHRMAALGLPVRPREVAEPA